MTMTAQEALTMTAPPVDPAQVATKTICLSLRRGRFGNNKKASMATVQFTTDLTGETQTDKTQLALRKRLLQSPELQAVRTLDGEVRRYLETVAFTSMFRGGVYLVPIAMVEQIEQTLQSFVERRAALVDVAAHAYPMRAQEAADRLGAVYNPKDYPSVARFREAFYFEWEYVTFDTPSRLKAISPALFEAERAKAQAKLAAVADGCRDAMRAGLLDLVDRVVERLTPEADGKKKVFTKTMVTNVEEFLGTFDLRNVTNDTDLAPLAAKVRDAMAGVDAKLLREDDLARQSFATKFAEVQALLTPMVVDRSTRAIDFDEDGDA